MLRGLRLPSSGYVCRGGTQTQGASLLDVVICLVASSGLNDAVASRASKGAQGRSLVFPLGREGMGGGRLRTRTSLAHGIRRERDELSVNAWLDYRKWMI